MKQKILLVSGAAVYKQGRGRNLWFVVKNKDDGWELPKTTARRGESSVRAAIRLMGEQGGMTAKVLEEVGRSGGATMVNGKPISQRYLFYLLFTKLPNEVLGFEDFLWLDYARAIRKLTAKRDITMLRTAHDMLKEIEKKKKKKQ